MSGGSSGSSKPRVLILYTGGTIGMKYTAGGLRPVSGYLLDVLSGISELRHQYVPDFDVLEWETLYDSADMTPALWIKIAQQIEHYYYQYDGFVILHGTDTMAYTASALSFMLENLGKTVVLTGSMIPLEAPVSDAKRNLIISLMVSAIGIPEVCIFFNSSLLRGNRTKKVDPWDNDAFQSPNMRPLARMGVAVDLNQQAILPHPKRPFRARTRLFTNISAMVMIPGMDDTCIRAFVDSPARACFISGSTNYLDKDKWFPCPLYPPQASASSVGATPLPHSSAGAIRLDRKVEEEALPPAIVLGLYGAGNAPVKRKDFLETIKYCVEQKKATVVITSQCIKGAVDMSQYETGLALSALGVIDAHDMTMEAAVTKLSYLLGRGLRGPALKQAMETNLRGELNQAKTRAYASINDDLIPRL